MMGEQSAACESSDMEERYLREILANLQRDYSNAAKPYIDRLVAIECRKPRPPMIVMIEQAQSLGFMLPNDEPEGK